MHCSGPCYQAGELVAKPFFGITLVDSVDGYNSNYSGNDTFYGGGLALDYYLTDRFAIGLEGSWIDTPSVVHGYSVNLTYRLTCPSNCLSVYVLGGGGVFTNGETVGSAHIGGGAEYRFTDNIGLFADARYTWLDGGDITLTQIRTGLSIKL